MIVDLLSILIAVVAVGFVIVIYLLWVIAASQHGLFTRWTPFR